MRKTLKDRIRKAGKSLIAVLTAASTLAFTPNTSPVYAESGGKLTSVYKFDGYFTHESLSALTKGYSAASVLKDGSGNIIADLFCIEPDKLTGIGVDYVDTGAAADPGVAGVIYAFHIDMVQDSSNGLAKYLGAQMAVWAKIRNNRAALDGLVAGEKDPATAAAAKEYAKKYFDGADAAYAANETAWREPYKLSSGDFSFTVDSTAVSFTSDSTKTLYFRSEPIHLDLNGDQAMLSTILSSVQYTVSLSNAPEGSFVADINGNKRDTFVPAQSFRVYVPVAASAGHSPMTVNVRINNGYTAWTTTSWNSDTHQDLVSQKAMAPGEKNMSLAVSFPAAITAQPKTIYTSALALSKVAIQPASSTVDADGITKIVWEKSALEGTRFSLTNTDSFTDSTGKTWAAGEYQTDTYTTDDTPADGNILFFGLPASNDGSPVSWTLSEMTSAPGYSKSGKTLKVKALAAKCPADAVGSAAYPECKTADDYMNGTISKYTAKEEYWLENTPIYLSFTFRKTAPNGKALPGALFGLYNEDPIRLTNGTTIPAGTLLAKLQSDTTGNVSTSNLGYSLPGNVNYFLQEESAPEGYEVNPETLRVVRRLTGEKQRYDVVNGQNATITEFVDEAIPANPEIQTSLKSVDGRKKVAKGSNITLIDTVTYSGLTPGEAYKVSGELMYHTAGSDNGTMRAAGTSTFTPPESDGTVNVTFILDTTKMNGGDLLTAFETLTKDGDDTVLASHKEITDQDQTVTVEDTPAPSETPKPTSPAENPRLGTTLTGQGGVKSVTASGDITLTDTVKYSGLTPGLAYTISGELHKINADGSDGGAVTASSRTLNPTSDSGTVDVVFTFDASELAGKKVVAFEAVSLNGKPVVSHEDLKDAGQTVSIEAPKLYTLKVQKMLSGSLMGSPEDNGINLAGSPLTFTIYKDGKEVRVLTKDDFKDGYYTADNLEAGVYTVKETKNMVSPVTINEFKYSIAQDTSEQQVALNQDKSVTFTNKTTDITESSIRIIKNDAENSSKVLEGAEFAIYAANDTNTALATGKTNANGILMFNNLKHGKYVIRELTAPEGYYKLSNDIPVDLSRSKQDAVTEVQVANTQEGARIKLVKTDKDSQKPVPGAIYGLYDEAGNELTRGTTDSEGVITFFGQYKDETKVYAKEITSPVGYRLDEAKHEITVDGTKQDLYEIKVEDEAYKVSLEIEKFDTNNSSKKLSGATFELYWKTDTAHKSRVAVVRTDKDGKARIDDLLRGEYVLVETEAPSGYAILEANKEISVDLRTKNDRSVTMVMVNNTKKTEAPSIKTTATVNGKKEASINSSGDLIVEDKVCYTNFEVGKKYTAYASLTDADGNTVADIISSGSAVNFTPASKNGCVTVSLKLDKSKIKTSTNLTIYEQVKLDGTMIARHEEKGNKDQTVTVTVPGTPTPTPSVTNKVNAARSTDTGVLGNNIPLSASLLSSGIALALILHKKRKE